MEARGDIAKLPKWAQSHIAVLTNQLESEQNRNRAMDAGESNVILVGWSQPDTQLPPNSTIRFKLGGEYYVDASIGRDGDRLQLHGGFGRMTVYPAASNAVDVGMSW